MAHAAAAAAAAAGGALIPPAPALSSFAAFHDDATKDEHNGTCNNLVNEFNAVGGRMPLELRQLATTDPKSSSLGYLCLIAAPGDPNHPGCLHAVHALSECTSRLGFGVSQWDGLQFGTAGDIIHGQLPNNVMLPGNSFQLVNGGHVNCLPTPARPSAEFAVAANIRMVGPHVNNPICYVIMDLMH